MTMHLGNIDAGLTLYIPFSTYAGSTGASATLTGLAVTDIEIYKNGSTTQRASDAGYVLLDTDGIDFDGITGIHGFSVDLSDNTDAGFFSAGAFYWVVVSAVTIDSQTVNFIAATFRIGPVAANTTQLAGQTVTAAAGVTFPTSVASPTNITAGTITTVTNLTNAPTSGDLTATMKTSVTTAATAATPIAASVTGAVGSVTGSVGSVVGLTAANLDVAVSTLATAANLATVAGYIDTEVAAIKTVTDRLDTAIELDGAVYRLTTNALEQAPSGGGGGLDAAGVRAAIGLASANLDTQLSAIDDFLDTEVAAIKAKTDNLPSDPADASDIATSFSTVNATLSTIAGYIDTEVAAIKAKTDLIPAAPAAVGDIPTAAVIADAVHDEVVEGSTTLRQSIRLHNSALGGKASGLATTNPLYRDLADTKNRINATVDADGNRSAITVDLT